MNTEMSQGGLLGLGNVMSNSHSTASSYRGKVFPSDQKSKKDTLMGPPTMSF